MLFFTFIKGGVTPLTGPPNINGFSSITRGGVKSLLTNVNNKMFFLMKASLIVAQITFMRTLCKHVRYFCSAGSYQEKQKLYKITVHL